MGKWLAGILATVISGVLVAILVPRLLPSQPSTTQPTSSPTSVSQSTPPSATVLCSSPTTVDGTSFLDVESCRGRTSGDVWWEQLDAVNRRLVPQNGATLVNLHAASFDFVSVQQLRSLNYSSAPIDGSNTVANQLTRGTVLAVKTRAGHYGKIRVDSYGYNLAVTVTTYA